MTAIADHGGRVRARALAAVLLTLGGIAILFATSFVVLSLGLAAIAGSLAIFRTTRGISPRPVAGAVPGEQERVGKAAWACAIGSIVFAWFCFQLLANDAARGHDQAWPVYAMVFACFFCIVAWGYIIGKLNR